MQCHVGVVHKALEELLKQVNVETADGGTGVRNMHLQARTARKVDDHARQRHPAGHKRDRSGHAFFVADRLVEGFTQGNTPTSSTVW